MEWLGDVPEHWDSCNLKFISKIYAGGTPDRNRLDYWVKGEIPWINSGAVNQVIIKEPSEYITELGLKNSSAKYIPVNSLVMALAGQGKTKGMVAYTSIETTCNQSMAAIVPKNYHYKFLYYWLDSNYQNIRNLTGGDNRDGLNLAVLSNIPCPKISIVEQTQIVSFLNTETTRIDNLITKQEKLIELLEEQRKSIISHAVTKGLNPNAPMKDSGVEWLGDVPEHWEVTRLKNIGKSIIGLTYSPNEICNPDDDSYLVLRSSNVQNGQLSFLDNVYVKSYVSEKLKIKKNDILICSRNGSRDLIGKNTIIKNPPKNSTFGAFMTVYRSEHADYVYWILNSYIFKAQAGSYLTTTVNQLTINNLNSMTVPFAPTSEQNEIVEFLSTENLKFNNLISKQKALIEKLKEYRASIISHAVTGKIDVMEFGA